MPTNSAFTFQQVVDGTGSFKESQTTGYSDGVDALQTYLRVIGYQIKDPHGYFYSSTKEAVEGFQFEMGITVDGVAGQKTCLRLGTVYKSEYFNTYGKPLTKSEWGNDNILAGKFTDIDLISRIVLAEAGYTVYAAESAVALVIKNRSVNSSSTYWASASEYPKASIYARVIGKASQYTTASESNETARVPRRGYHGTEENGFVDPGWKHSVDVAKKVVNDVTISVTGYLVKGSKVTANKRIVSTANSKQYLNQTSWSSYLRNYDKGDVSEDVTPLTFEPSGGEVIYKM